MFRIGEFSRLTQVSIRMLRYYDEAGLLKPAQVDSWTGHRLYAAEQIPHLNRIRYLRDSGFQVSEIARALEMDDVEPFQFRMTEPVPIMASTMVYGDFSNIKGAYLAFARWLGQHGVYQMTCPTRQIVHRGPWNEADPTKYLTELQIPLVAR